MDQQARKIYTDNLQKNLTKTCFVSCKRDMKVFHRCFDQCHEKYLRTINIVHGQMKQIMYNKLSLIAYKGFPEDTIEQAFRSEEEIANFQMTVPFARQNQTGG